MSMQRTPKQIVGRLSGAVTAIAGAIVYAVAEQYYEPNIAIGLGVLMAVAVFGATALLLSKMKD